MRPPYPITCNAADGKTTLHRFHVQAIMYARDATHAMATLKEISEHGYADIGALRVERHDGAEQEG